MSKKLLMAVLSGIRVASCQILQGCNDIGCPLVAYQQYTCPIGNMTTSLIGTTAFNSSLSETPLTWTTAVVETFLNSTRTRYQRPYMLGSSPTAGIFGGGSAEACAIFFTGATTLLQFPGNLSQSDIGTCQDAMGEACTADLQLQARAFLGGQDDKNDTDCNELALFLQKNPPPSCGFIQNNSWGLLTSKAITGPTAPEPLNLTTCNPSIKADYEVRLIETDTFESENILPLIAPFGFGVTPILTVTHPLVADPNAINLSCLKPIQQMLGETSGAGQNFGSRLSAGGWTWLIGLLTSTLAWSVGSLF